MYYVIEDRGKQYLVKDNSTIDINFFNLKQGSVIKYIDKISNNKELEFIVENHKKTRKINSIKFKRRKNYIRNKSYKQYYTCIKHVNTKLVKEL